MGAHQNYPASTKFGNSNKVVFHVGKGAAEHGSQGKMSPDLVSNTEKLVRRQKQNNSLLIPHERINKFNSFVQSAANKVSLASAASLQEGPADIHDFPTAPRGGK